MNDYQKYIAISRYARYLEEENRREHWHETVTRYMMFMKEHLETNNSYKMPKSLYKELWEAILNFEVMPSMRCIMTAGPALARDNICGYNCAAAPVDHPRIFDECLYILMCGTGFGFSVERQFITKLPEIPDELYPTDTTIVVRDSKKGWAKAYKELISMLYAGQIPKWDTTQLREAGARLKTMGGRSSGPEPLRSLFEFTVAKFQTAAGRKLNSIECHDIMCKIGDVVVVGGVRRSAEISLSNLTDDRMRHAKSGQWWLLEPQRALSNNSVCYTEKPDEEAFMREWLSLVESKSGERGIINRAALNRKVISIGRREAGHEWIVNPCGEIILRPKQFCNLSEIVVRTRDTIDILLHKARLATILGTFQATLTNFQYIRPIWKKNTEEERLLGVSMTGIMDGSITFFPDCDLEVLLEKIKEEVIATNKKFAKKLGIPQSAATTCNKPSGTVSQLVDAASGIHTRWSKFYIRTVRSDIKDPLTTFLIAQGVPYEPAIGQEGTTVVFSFPHKSPEGAVIRADMTAIEQLELWKHYQEFYCEHNPSITVYVREGEWLEVGAFVYKNFDTMAGVSFLPYDNGSYQQAPYQEINENQYDEAIAAMPEKIDWESFTEEVDNTTSSQEYACQGGACEIL